MASFKVLFNPGRAVDVAEDELLATGDPFIDGMELRFEASRPLYCREIISDSIWRVTKSAVPKGYDVNRLGGRGRQSGLSRITDRWRGKEVLIFGEECILDITDADGVDEILDGKIFFKKAGLREEAILAVRETLGRKELVIPKSVFNLGANAEEAIEVTSIVLGDFVDSLELTSQDGNDTPARLFFLKGVEDLLADMDSQAMTQGRLPSTEFKDIITSVKADLEDQIVHFLFESQPAGAIAQGKEFAKAEVAAWLRTNFGW
ncbi:MAG: hypothetical protein R2828_19015 [Saprospiraceae bacterium]